MNRRKFIKKASIAGGSTALAASIFPAPAISQSRIRWNAVSAFGKAGLLGQALEEFTKFVGTASEGNKPSRLIMQVSWLNHLKLWMRFNPERHKWDMAHHTTGQVNRIPGP